MDEEWSNNTIINNLKNPCLKAAADKVLSPSLNKTFNKLIQGVFGKNDKVNLILVEGETNGNLGKTQASQDGSIINVTTTLDPNVFVGASQEYIASTIIHEAFHGIRRVYYQNYLMDHFVMFNTSLLDLSASLKAAFPSLSDADATDLILKGILALDLSVNPINGEFSPAVVDQVIGHAGSTRSRIANTVQRFSTTSSGTPCN